MLDEILSLFPESIVSHVVEVLSSHLKSRPGYFQVTEIQAKDHEYLGLWISIQSWKINDKFHCYWYIRDCRETVIQQGSAGSRDDALLIAQRQIDDIDLFFIHHKRSSTRN
ncbi:hypothetical protein [Microcoleus sp. S13_B4]|uniref:hypothetical protein n=1 Tax=Microcoleus sp. S13_B4 TaxID=3055408 RepID=UPI002FCF2672